MLFNKALVEKILSARRLRLGEHGKGVWSERMYAAKTDYRNYSIFAYLYIKYVRRERLMDIDDGGAIREGFSSLQEFNDVWIKCYGSWNPNGEVYVIGFGEE